jgi:DNA-binding CsgD family transcriptional regulator/PAS domain-containing protein
MSIDQNVLDTLDTIYAAASDTSLWAQVINRVMGVVESQAASFCVIDASDPLSMPVFHYINAEKRLVDYDLFMREYLVDGMAAQDPTLRHIVAHPEQRLVRDSSIVSEAEKDRHPYYDWHASYSDTRHRMAGMISPAPHLQSGVTLHRTRQLGDFDDGQIARFNFLLPHIERAVRLSFQLGTLGAFRHASQALLDGNERAVIFLDRKGRILFANRAASELSASADGLLLSRDGLSLANPADQRRLDRLIAAALAPSAARPGNGMMQAGRPSGKRPFSILVSPIRAAENTMAEMTPAICITLTDPEALTPIPGAALRDLFGLTRSEARLAARLACGDSLAQAAEGLGLAYATVRAQLAAIFRKTQTNRQGELVRLLLASVPASPAER